MEPEPKFLENLIVAVTLLTVIIIPVRALLRRRSQERQRHYEEEIQRETFRYVEEKQAYQDKQIRSENAKMPDFVE